MFRILLLLITLPLPSYAIIIRHDVPDEQYRATINDFPALATLYVDGAHGTLIAPEWVVTAAHASFCIKPKSTILINGRIRQIGQLYVHPDYQPGESHDIALMQLSAPALDVTPAKLYQKEDEEGLVAWFIGIGGTGNGELGETIDNALNNGLLRQAQNRIHAAQGPLLIFEFDKGEQALPLEGVSGGGDSGGPAFIRTQNGFELLGVSSRFTGGSIGQYGISEYYSRISFFYSWIDSIITGDDGQRASLAQNRLAHLPAGLTPDILPSVCNAIAINDSHRNLIK
ncbi:S1 family peptidase [Alteromonas facilis]|uniref:S1 family peptidase n=1 Tax=Alteromonas facilis TaxID=2048004 RepID=UPI000C28C58B|nr:trypsin-like serine protease [Alteromonas facilis]